MRWGEGTLTVSLRRGGERNESRGERGFYAAKMPARVVKDAPDQAVDGDHTYHALCLRSLYGQSFPKVNVPSQTTYDSLTKGRQKPS